MVNAHIFGVYFMLFILAAFPLLLGISFALGWTEDDPEAEQAFQIIR